jgi:hypothetical protein
MISIRQEIEAASIEEPNNVLEKCSTHFKYVNSADT